MKSHIKILALLFMATASASAAADSIPDQRRLVLDRVAASQAAVQPRPQALFSANPATFGYWRQSALSAIEARGNYLSRDEAETVQEGTGRLLGSIDAVSFMPLSATTAVWGGAGFTTGQYRGIRWNNSADYSLVAPYVYGDSVGGNLQTRQYTFSGGYSGRSHGWGWGAEAAYRAAIDYRNRDPRDKIVVSDLSIDAGVSRELSNDYLIGLSGGLRIYNQESDVEFYNPNNDIRAYALTGLGNYYARFSGNSNLNTAYKGTAGRASMQYLPAEGDGLMITLDGAYTAIRQILRDFNNLDLTRLDTYTGLMKAAYSFRAGKILMVPTLRASFTRKLGYENIFGSSVGNNYEKIARKRNYYADRAEAHLSLPVEIPVSAGFTLSVEPGASTSYLSEDYRKPHRRFASLLIGPSLNLSGSWRIAPLWQLDISAHGTYLSADIRSEQLAALYAARQSSLATATLHNCEMQAADRTTAAGQAKLLWGADRSFSLFLKAGGGATFYRHHGKAAGAEVSFGAIF